jgi:hypothetical protein
MRERRVASESGVEVEERRESIYEREVRRSVYLERYCLALRSFSGDLSSAEGLAGYTFS